MLYNIMLVSEYNIVNHFLYVVEALDRERATVDECDGRAGEIAVRAGGMGPEAANLPGSTVMPSLRDPRRPCTPAPESHCVTVTSQATSLGP